MLQSQFSLFDSFFAPTRVIVVSEERLQQAEREAREAQINALDTRIEELSKYRISLLKQLEPDVSKPGSDLDAMDGVVSDV
tara:strand:+ start:194 stop:436 length:243 start_codon:yes stop_codon:yes gene_type:complete